MTVGEIKLVLDNYVEKIKAENESKQQLIYTVSALTASFINRSFNGKEIPTYESIFKPEIEEKNRIIMFREQMKQFVIEHNRRQK